MRSSRLLRPLPVLLALLLSACATTSNRQAEPVASQPATAVTAANDNLHATLWMQSSAEYFATMRGQFAQARRQLDAALATPSWDALAPNERPIGSGFESLPPAVIVDLDETMIDNSPFQARGVRDGVGFTPERWFGWVQERNARALPGAVEFARAAADRGVTVYYLSNRLHATEHDSTADNLLALGFPLDDDRATLLLKGDPRASASPKAVRRAYVGARHRVLLMLGDQLGDFVDGDDSTQTARANRASAFDGWWGERWFMLPNPTYGDWERVHVEQCAAELAEADRRACLHAGLRMN